MLDSLKDELITEILARLSVKSLIRCRCVSKRLKSIISNRNFINTHLALSNPRYPSDLVVFHNFDYLLKKDCPPAIRIRVLSLDPKIEKRSLVAGRFDSKRDRSDFKGSYPLHGLMGVIGSANGVFCLIKGSKYVLCNPSLQKAISIPPKIGRKEGSKYFGSGFGYDSNKKDYKLVTLVDVKGATEAEIYSLQAGEWHSSKDGPPYRINLGDIGPLDNVFFNGAVHWPATTPKNQKPFRNLIMSFNMKDEVFGEMAMPNSFQDESDLLFYIAVINGLLALILDRKDGRHLSVWVMEKYGRPESWTKQYDIKFEFGLYHPIGFRKNGEVLLVHKGHLFSYESNSERTSYLHVYKFGARLYFDTYVESLALLHVANGVLGVTLTSSCVSELKEKKKKRKLLKEKKKKRKMLM